MPCSQVVHAIILGELATSAFMQKFETAVVSYTFDKNLLCCMVPEDYNLKLNLCDNIFSVLVVLKGMKY